MTEGPYKINVTILSVRRCFLVVNELLLSKFLRKYPIKWFVNLNCFII